MKKSSFKKSLCIFFPAVLSAAVLPIAVSCANASVEYFDSRTSYEISDQLLSLRISPLKEDRKRKIDSYYWYLKMGTMMSDILTNMTLSGAGKWIYKNDPVSVFLSYFSSGLYENLDYLEKSNLAEYFQRIIGQRFGYVVAKLQRPKDKPYGYLARAEVKIVPADDISQGLVMKLQLSSDNETNLTEATRQIEGLLSIARSSDEKMSGFISAYMSLYHPSPAVWDIINPDEDVYAEERKEVSFLTNLVQNGMYGYFLVNATYGYDSGILLSADSKNNEYIYRISWLDDNSGNEYAKSDFADLRRHVKPFWASLVFEIKFIRHIR